MVKLINKRPDGLDATQLSMPIAVNWRVDHKAGRLNDVALITGDREATGHGLYIDQRTLETGRDSIQARGGRIKAGLRHQSMADWWSRNEDRIADLPGFFQDVTLRGKQLVAGSLEFYESFKKRHADEFAHVMEIADKTPELIGLSIEAWGYGVFVDEEGNEYSEKPNDLELRYAGMPAFRITDLAAAALVDEPAANNGLFATFSRLFGHPEKRGQLDALGNIAKAFLAFSESAEGRAVLDAGANGGKAAAGAVNSPPHENTHEMNILAELKKKFADDQERYKRAAHLHLENEKLSVDEIDAKLKAEDDEARAKKGDEPATVEALRAHYGENKADLKRAFDLHLEDEKLSVAAIVGKLAAADAAELKKLREENAAMAKDLAAEKKRFAELKSSGHEQGLDLQQTNGKQSPGARELGPRQRMAARFRSDPENPANLIGRN